MLELYKPLELISQILKENPSFPLEKKEKADSLWEEISELLLSMQKSMPEFLVQKKDLDLMSKYRCLKESFNCLKVSMNFFSFCRLILGTEFYVKHTSVSTSYYTFARRFLVFAEAFLKEVFGAHKSVDYVKVSKYNAQFKDFTYPRKISFYQAIIKAIDELFLFQRGTNFFLVNWELRIDIFFTVLGSLDYMDLFQRSMMDPLLAEKEEIIRLLSVSYEVLISEMKKEFEKSKQDFFFKNVLILLEEYKKFNVLLGNTEKSGWLDRNLSSWKRGGKKGK